MSDSTAIAAQFDAATIERAKALMATCKARGLMIATAESCTGGLIAALLTEIPGCSSVVERGFVTYSNDAKTEMLCVPADLIHVHGAVSRPVAEAMATGALAHSHADIAVSVTGIAGPDGGTPDKPVGLVHFAGATRAGGVVPLERRFGDLGRAGVRAAALDTALHILETLAAND